VGDMKMRRALVILLAVSTAAIAGVGPSAAEPSPPPGCSGAAWVAAWTASVQGAGNRFSSSMTGHSVTPPNDAFDNQTVRQVAHLHFGGQQIRITLSNLFGTRPVRFDETHAALRAEAASVVAGSDRRLTFAGGEVTSDPAPLAVVPFSDLVVSVFTAGPTGPATLHANAVQNYYTASGNHTGDGAGGAFSAGGDVSDPYRATFTTQVYFLRMVEVLAPASSRTVVAFGDSITDGFFSSADAHRRYPVDLARRLQADPATAHLAVAGQAISGGRVLHDGFGPSALHRLDREVLALHPVAVVFMQGLNDIGQPIAVRPPGTVQERVSAEDIIAG